MGELREPRPEAEPERGDRDGPRQQERQRQVQAAARRGQLAGAEEFPILRGE